MTLFTCHVSAVCYIRTVSTVCVLICCCSSQLIIAITHASSNTTTAILYDKCCTEDGNMYNTLAPPVSVSHHIEYNRWAGHSTSNCTTACISYTRTICAAMAKQHRSIDLHTRMNHTRTATKIVQTKGPASSSHHLQYMAYTRTL